MINKTKMTTIINDEIGLIYEYFNSFTQEKYLLLDSKDQKLL